MRQVSRDWPTGWKRRLCARRSRSVPEVPGVWHFVERPKLSDRRPKRMKTTEGNNGGSLRRVVRARCEQCEQERVPQYDEELRLAAEALAEWMRLADQLHRALGCARRENRVKYAQNAYANLCAKYRNVHGVPERPNAEVSDGGHN